MKIVVALASFKGTLTAAEACELVRAGLSAVRPELDVVLKPMADGGEGTAAAVLRARGGEWLPVRVMGPLESRQIEAGWAWFPDRGEALVEMAAASGLTLLQRHELNPLKTTTYGTGQLIAEAIRRGARHLLLAVGGSATVDGGTGAAAALGWRFLDRAGRPVPLGGGFLEQIARIEKPAGPDLPPLEVLCDVTNPLCGPRGAARVFGPQKGATPAMVAQLERGLEHLADLVQQTLGRDIRDVPGAGAAGGLAAGALAFFAARLTPGIETVMAVSGLNEALAGADWVITGEGRLDEQSWQGKVVAGVTATARQRGVRVGIIAGSVALPPDARRPDGIAAVRSAQPPGMPLDVALARARPLLRAAAKAFAREHL